MPQLTDDLYLDPNVAQFYDLPGRVRDDFSFCERLAEGAASVLDLGCGTGELTVRLAEGRDVVGVDPADAMLQIARKRPGGDAVAWHLADARSVHLGRRFDLVMLTGHAFQVFLTPVEQAAVLAAIVEHLTPNGRFVFDSRNPDFPDPKERSCEQTTKRFWHPELGEIEAWNISRYDPEAGILAYENAYRILSTGKVHAATAKIRYTPQPDLAAMIDAAGLAVDNWFGDWAGAPFQAESREIIPIGRLKESAALRP
ncbi:MAG: methyltransferase domain-containing protein [Pseudomonadota bacterium]